MMTPEDRILSPSRADADDALAGLRRAGISSANAPETAEFLRHLDDACDEAGIEFAFAASHCGNETNLFRDDLFKKRRNPAGIGVTGEPGVLGPVFPSYRAAARFYVAELLLKLRRPLGTFAEARQYAPAKFDAVKALVEGSEGPFPTITRIRDLNQRFGPPGRDGRPRECAWMCDPNGPEAICQKAALLFPDLPDQKGENPVPTFSTVIPGLPGGPLVTDYRVIVDLIPASMKKNRSGIKAESPRRSIQHGNGNGDSSALGERNFLHAGAPDGQGRAQTLSYHAAGDDKAIYVLVPLDEVTWQAADGDGPGNMNGYSFELVEDNALWANAARRGRAISMAADFMGRVGARLGVAKPERHWDFNWAACGFPEYTERSCGARHDCPNKLKHVTMSDGRKAWDHYAEQWQRSRADELRRMQGGTTTTTTTAPPQPKPLRLPKGMSSSVAKRLFNPHGFSKPGGGRISFNLNGAVGQAWLRNALATIPEGKAWTEGVWDGLDSVIRRGDGRIVYAFGNLTVEQPA